MTLIQRIAALIQQYKNCVKAGNKEWEDRCEKELDEIAENYLPSGSGIDCGTQIDIDESDSTCIVLGCQYHHMSDCGMYDGWTEHRIEIEPTFDGIDITIKGRDRNGIKEYLADVYHHCLNQELGDDYSTPWEREIALRQVAELHESF